MAVGVDVTDLRGLFVFDEFSDEQLAWVAERAETCVAEGDGRIVGYGESATFFVLLEGELEVRVMVGGRERVLASSTTPGAYGGGMGSLAELGIVTKSVPVSVVARPGSRLLRMGAEAMKQMIVERYPIVSHFMAGMQVMRRYEEMAGDHEKMASLGKISAGLAHELNNPAAAARRAASLLGDEIDGLLAVTRAAASLDPDLVDRVRASCRGRAPTAGLDPIERSDREEAIADRLEAAGVGDAWEVACDLVEAGCDLAWFDTLPAELRGSDLDCVLRLAVAEQRVSGLVADLQLSLGRVGELIDAMKDFTHGDRAPDADVDVHQGIETTLTISAHQVPDGTRVVRDFDPDLPPVPGHAGELNQIWANLLDNAFDAVGEGGTVTVSTRREGDEVVVLVADDGPGIPADVKDRIFDLFFTTKDVGEGSGLGLDIVRRIVEGHGGTIEVESEPGEGTTFTVRLPLAR